MLTGAIVFAGSSITAQAAEGGAEPVDNPGDMGTETENTSSVSAETVSEAAQIISVPETPAESAVISTSVEGDTTTTVTQNTYSEATENATAVTEETVTEEVRDAASLTQNTDTAQTVTETINGTTVNTTTGEYNEDASVTTKVSTTYP